MAHNLRNGKALLLAALACGGGALLDAAPAPVAANLMVSMRAPPTDAWVLSATGNGTDYTTGYEPRVVLADTSVVSSGSERVAGDTGRLLLGQFGWVEGHAVQHLTVMLNTMPGSNLLSQVQVTPGRGWFMAIDRQVGVTDVNLRDGFGAGFSPLEGERFDLALDWEGKPGCPGDETRHAWQAGPEAPSGSTTVNLAVEHLMDELDSGVRHRYDRLAVRTSSAAVGSAVCNLDIEVSFRLRFVFDGTGEDPVDPGSNGLGTEDLAFKVEAVRFQLELTPGSMNGPAAQQTVFVAYVPLVFVNWVCVRSGSVDPAKVCAEAAMRSAAAGGPTRVAFPAPGGGFYGLTMGQGNAGWQGALTAIPVPYTSYEPTRTKLVTLDARGYNEVDWPYVPDYY